jgi:WD domain, G-beta repeat
MQNPSDTAAVLGQDAPTAGLVLGGLEGLAQRWASPVLEHRLAVLRAAATYGVAGVPLLAQGLAESPIGLQKLAYQLLCQQVSPEAEAALADYSPFRLFNCLCTLSGSTQGITAVAMVERPASSYRAAQTLILSATRDGLVTLWDLDAEEAIDQFQTWSFITGMWIDVDEDLLILRNAQNLRTALGLRSLRPVELPEGFPIETLKPRGVSSVECADGRTLFSGNQRDIKVWDLAAKQQVMVLRGHTGLVTAVALSPDQSYLISGSEDRTVRIWGIP